MIEEQNLRFVNLYELVNKLKANYKINQFNFDKKDFIKLRDGNPYGYKLASKIYNADSIERVVELLKIALLKTYNGWVKEDADKDQPYSSIAEREFDSFMAYIDRAIERSFHIMERLATRVDIDDLKGLSTFFLKYLICGNLLYYIMSYYIKMEKTLLQEPLDEDKSFYDYIRDNFLKSTCEHIMNENFTFTFENDTLILQENTFPEQEESEEDSKVDLIDAFYIIGFKVMSKTSIGLESFNRIEERMRQFPETTAIEVLAVSLAMISNIISNISGDE